MLSGRGTWPKHETHSATMSILPKTDIAAGIDDPGNTGAARSENVSTQNNGAAVAGIAEPGAEDAKSAASDRGYNLPNSRKVYLSGEIHPDIRAPFREISLAPTKTMSGEIEANEPVRVYDTSGPWGDNASPARTVTLDPGQGLPALRRDWSRDRGDVEEIEGRQVRPIDDG